MESNIIESSNNEVSSISNLNSIVSTPSPAVNNEILSSPAPNLNSKVSFSLPLTLLSNNNPNSSPINSPTSSSSKKFFIPGLNLNNSNNNCSLLSSTPSTPKTPVTPNRLCLNKLNQDNNGEHSIAASSIGEVKLDRRELENELNFIDTGVYLGNLETASNLTKLQSCNITNILNCAGEKSTNYFPQHFKYKTIIIRDIPDEDISCLFFIILDYFTKILNRNGVIFVHCYRGVSRSSAFVILWLMWKNKWSYQKAFEFLVEKRKVASPNIGFEFQLRRFEKYILPNNNSNNNNSNNSLALMKQLIINDSSNNNNNSGNNNSNCNGEKQIPLLYKMIKRADSIIIPQPVVPLISSDSLDHSTCYLLRSGDNIYIWYGINSSSTYGQKPVVNHIKKYINRFKKFDTTSDFENESSNLIELINCNNSNSLNNDFIKFKKILDSTL